MKDAAQRGRGIWRSLSGDQRLAGVAAVGLFATMFLPWYQYTAVAGRGAIADSTVNAFQVFDFTEAAVLLVAAAVIALLVGRAEGGTFSLPGRDGTFVLAGGVWVCLLIFLRQLDKPDGPEGTVVGVAWGIFVAFVAGIALAAAGWRMRQDEDPGPPLLRRDDDRGQGEPAGPGSSAQPSPTQPGSSAQPSPAQPGSSAQPSPAQPGSSAQPSPTQPRSSAQPSPTQPGSSAQPNSQGNRRNADSPDSAPTLFDDIPDDPEPPTRPMRPGEIPPAR